MATGAQARLDGFWRSLPYQPDRFQREAGEALEDGATVVVTAPTGSGKTLVAEAAVHLALESGERAFYTTPIKALSNQKFGDFIVEYGARPGGSAHRGQLDQRRRPHRGHDHRGAAQHDLRRFARTSSRLGGGDPRRGPLPPGPGAGPVWEEIIIHAPRHIQLVGLSATIANAAEFAAWVETRRGPTRLVEENLATGAAGEPVHGQGPLVAAIGADGRDLSGESTVGGAGPTRRCSVCSPKGHRRRFGTPRRHRDGGAPRRGGDAPRHLLHLLQGRVRVGGASDRRRWGRGSPPPDEREEIRTVQPPAPRTSGTATSASSGYDPWLAHLEHGVAAHHAGLVPAFKETVEDLFSAGLVRAVFATETLALGINMPAKTVVLESLSKFTGEGHELLQPGDYTQLTGRAGRRGIDLRGLRRSCSTRRTSGSTRWPRSPPRGSHELVSSFRPTYNMAANLVSNYPRRRAEELLAASFAQFQRKNRASAVAAGIEGLESELDPAA